MKLIKMTCNKCSFRLFDMWFTSQSTLLITTELLLPGPSCSKLTTSLVNVSLKFQTLILQIHCNFLLKKFFQQKITVYLLLELIFA